MFMYVRLYRRFDIVDLDPYGAPTQFLDGAVHSVADGGTYLVLTLKCALPTISFFMEFF